MAKPIDKRSSDELREALGNGELAPRKAAFAKEILRRRGEAIGQLSHRVKHIFGAPLRAVRSLGKLLRPRKEADR